MELTFYKYQGTGNDFILIDNRNLFFHKIQKDLIHRLCDRKFGIGADGLILLENHSSLDFEMVYFNADGNESTMCGNGGRCMVIFAQQLGIISNTTQFLAIDGLHEAIIVGNNWVELKMGDVNNIETYQNDFILNTGSPHYVQFKSNLDDLSIFEAGQTIRYSSRFKEEGINVNFVVQQKNVLEVATYERGVEDETLSCGTGVVASALSYHRKSGDSSLSQVNIKTKGGDLAVKWKFVDNSYQDIWLCGPAKMVFEGRIELRLEDRGCSE